MPYFDLPIEELRNYAPGLVLPEGGRRFWDSTIAAAREVAKPAQWVAVDTGLRLVETYDVTFSGFDGQPVRAWLHLPAGIGGELPAVCCFQGYGGGRGLAHEVPHYTLAGYASLVMDTRGQGSAWRPGDTPDPEGAGPAAPACMTRGILDPEQYYYRRLFTDVVMAIEALRSHPRVRAERVVAAGASQGGGMAIAAAALHAGVWAVLADVPFLCDFRRATQLVAKQPYQEIVTYLSTHRDHAEAVFATLAYFDAAALASWASAPALFSVGLMDDVCPPSTVYAAYNAYGRDAGPDGVDKCIAEYPFNGHEGGEAFHQAAQLQFLSRLDP